ncbi:hypothetical protein GCM10018790_77820 [Kitasatospora xanthocidica]|nr:hypothetical protein GCM10018790_77820 [Kitasatospora xanthocidica]
MLVAGDEIEVHMEETSPPWIRVVAADGARVAAVVRGMGVRVEVRRG